jgi:hypothetical protein
MVEDIQALSFQDGPDFQDIRVAKAQYPQSDRLAAFNQFCYVPKKIVGEGFFQVRGAKRGGGSL